VSHSSRIVSQPGRAARAGRLALSVLAAALVLTAVGDIVGAGRSGAQTLSQWEGLDLLSPAAASTTAMSAVSCDSPGSCTAVGVATPALVSGGIGNYAPVVDTLSGGAWQSSEPAIGNTDLFLQDDSCLTGWCMAVGYEETENAEYQYSLVPVAALDVAGSWTQMAATGGLGLPNASLSGVSCTTTTSCVAVGQYVNASGNYEPLILAYDGTGWTQTALTALEATTSGASLQAVSCADATDCDAVGGFVDSNGAERSLAVVLSGGTWTVEPLGSLYPSAESQSYLDGVSCPVAAQCEAVGDFVPVGGSEPQGLIGTLDGVGTSLSNWDPDYYTQGPTGTTFLAMTSVSCVTPASCIAVGEITIGDLPSIAKRGLDTKITPHGVFGLAVTSGIVETITDDSASYSAPVTPRGSSYSYLSGVSCASDFSCEAIGTSDNDTAFVALGYAPPIITSADGTTFTQGTPGSFTVQSSGEGPVTLTESGALPPYYNGDSVSFTDADTGTGNDTATLAGTPGPYTGNYPIQITATDGAGNTETQYFDLTVNPIGPVPTVTSVTPSQGGAGGGASVVIKGTNFTNAIAVLFGGVNAVQFTVVSSTKVTATSPAGDGTEYVTVVGPGGESTETYLGEFSYVPPVVTSVTPAAAAGGATVTLHGQYMSGVTSVLFEPGGYSSKISVNAAGTAVTALVPTLQAGPADIVVSSTAGSYYFDGFSYLLPTITKLTPSSGPFGGGNEVQITGVDFAGVYQVNFGGYVAPAFYVNSADTVITAIAPSGPSGTVPVSVSSYYGTSGSFANYTINSPTLTGVEPSTAAIGSIVTIAGSSIYQATSVQFGNYTIPQDGIFYNTPTSLTVQVPAQTGGSPVSVLVTITNGLGTSNSVTFNYTYPPGP
jgi:IPT/TIG domain